MRLTMESMSLSSSS
uniref:Uncharacterized protein n=1 Tax=Arundo donax TaxID=35708 RepID=A0A0A8YZZ2_ARUDO